ncbi:N-acetylneuraminate synthase family protein [Halomicroarcula sp. GCM10025817]|uniref:N-acetylneuraminate synthase family protein n=1 Tax=Haloarcula TaxID=2237 RepID=UPI0023E84D19|nr:N-acetylneuraminate synthase family protein [Halomicroarcula sp. SYNS111]
MSLRGDTPYIIAEVGGNHGGDVDTAKRYLEAAAKAGADAVKFQLYRAETLIVEDADPLPLASDDVDSQFERFRSLQLTEDEWHELAALADENNVDFAASPFDRELADLTAELAPFIKVASGEVTNVPFLRYLNDLGVPVVMSTGFATVDEVRTAVAQLPDVDLTLLHCVGSYPTPDEQAHLELMDVLAEEFDVPVGYSDHTVGVRAPLAAVARGATVIEKHFTLDKSQNVGDHRLSANPEEMATIVEESERIAAMVDNWDRETYLPVEEEIRTDMRRSLAVSEPVSVGDHLTEDVLTALRPATGIDPRRIDDVVGTRVTRDLAANTILIEADVEE